MRLIHLSKTIILLLFPLIYACQNQVSPSKSYSLPPFSEDGIHAVIEIPAGTNLKVEYQSEEQRFLPDTLDGKPRRVDFLPYVGNYGFIPSTLMDETLGGDGDALDVLVLSESVDRGTVMNVKPIATLMLLDDGEIDTKIIAIPVDSTQRIIQATNFQELFLHYGMVKLILEEWFLNYKGPNRTTLLGWQDEVYALEEIKKWTVK